MILYKTFHFFFSPPFLCFRLWLGIIMQSLCTSCLWGPFSAPRSSKVVIIARNRFCFRLLRLKTRQIYCNEKALSGTRSIVSAGQRERSLWSEGGARGKKRSQNVLNQWWGIKQIIGYRLAENEGEESRPSNRLHKAPHHILIYDK